MKPILLAAAGAALFSLLCGPLGAAEPNAAEAKLRESLRATMLQLRTSENERATLQAAQAESEQKAEAGAAKIAAMSKQLAEQTSAAEKAAAELKAKMDARDAEVARLNESLREWKAAHGKISAVAAAKESQRAKAAGEVIVLQRQVADQQVRNLAMFKLGSEILTRYEKFGLGEALTAREPFIGTTRVKFENLMQDFGDKLSDSRIKPAEIQPAPPLAKGSPASAEKAVPAATTRPSSRGKLPDQRTKP